MKLGNEVLVRRVATYGGNAATTDASTKFRVLIADQQCPSREALMRLLEKDDSIEVVSDCANGNEALAAIEKHKPDMAFIHVHLPDIDAFEVVESTDYRIPAVVYMSAFDRYAADAFDADAADYIVKPFRDERLLRAIERAKLRVHVDRHPITSLSSFTPSSGDNAAAIQVSKYIRRLRLRYRGRTYLQRVELVDFFSSAANYVVAHWGSEKHRMRSSMSELEANLDPEQFVRIHRCTIVNIDRLKHLRPLTHSKYEVVLVNGTKLIMSRGYRAGFERVFLARG